MAETQEKVRETEVSQKGDTQVVRERKSTASSEDTRFTLVNGVWYLVGVVEVLLALRFALKLFGANPRSGFVDFVYSLSGFFTAPFRGIFSTPTAEGDITTAVFETSTVVAIVVYALIGWGLAKLLTLGSKQD
jgi:hypothetical protein